MALIQVRVPTQNYKVLLLYQVDERIDEGGGHFHSVFWY